MLTHERRAWKDGFLHVAGVDEAGRGPLAGPVTAAAVLFRARTLRATKQRAPWEELNDSKQLTEKKREQLFEALTSDDTICWAVVSVDPEEIDRVNILNATHLAMARALEQLQNGDPAPDLALVDGLPVKGLPVDHRAIVKGDSASLSIAAASIIAKVTRDRFMVKLAAEYPAYGFERHKGYGTKAHLAALREHGPCPHHRRSFRPVAQMELF